MPIYQLLLICLRNSGSLLKVHYLYVDVCYSLHICDNLNACDMPDFLTEHTSITWGSLKQKIVNARADSVCIDK